MSNIITTRDLAMVTSDIQYAQRQGARQLASNLIEIGRLLVEARTMVEPRDWEKYIWDNFGYSTSSADNWIKLYKEYGDDQESLFSSFTDSQTFGRMSYTKLLALTAIPAEERMEFVEQNDVENMSTRQLQQAIKERDEARNALAKAEDDLITAEAHLDDAQEDLERAKNSAHEAQQEAKEYLRQANQAKAERDKAEKSENNALNLVKKLNKELEKAKEKQQSLQADLDKARENPEIPESIMEQMRGEIEAEAARKATADIQKKLDTARKAADEAARAREEAEARTREAEEKLASAQREAKMKSPDVAVFETFYVQLQETWNRAIGAYKKVQQTDEIAAAVCHRALKAAITNFQKGMEEEPA